MTTHPLTQHTALAAARAILLDLRDAEPCDLYEDGCHMHGWRSAEPCPQVRLKHLLRELDQATPAAYTAATVRAVLRGLTPGQAVHVRVLVNGYAHTGELLGTHRRTGAPDSFRVRSRCGTPLEHLAASDIMDMDVEADPSAAARDEFGERYDAVEPLAAPRD